MSTQTPTPSRAKSRALHVIHLDDGRVVRVDSQGAWPRMTLPAGDTCQGMRKSGEHEAMYCGASWAPGHTHGYCGGSTCEAARLLHSCANAADGCPNQAVRSLNLCAICAGTDDKREHAGRVGNKAQKGRSYVSPRDHYRQLLKRGNAYRVVATAAGQHLDGRHRYDGIALLAAAGSAIFVIWSAEAGLGVLGAVATGALVAASAYAGRELFQSAQSARVAVGTRLGAKHERATPERRSLWDVLSRRAQAEENIAYSGPDIDERAAKARVGEERHTWGTPETYAADAQPVQPPKTRASAKAETFTVPAADGEPSPAARDAEAARIRESVERSEAARPGVWRPARRGRSWDWRRGDSATTRRRELQRRISAEMDARYAAEKAALAAAGGHPQ